MNLAFNIGECSHLDKKYVVSYLFFLYLIMHAFLTRESVQEMALVISSAGSGFMLCLIYNKPQKGAK